MTRLHPQSMRDLRQLVRLHGAPAIIEAVRAIERERKANDIADTFRRNPQPKKDTNPQ